MNEQLMWYESLVIRIKLFDTTFSSILHLLKFTESNNVVSENQFVRIYMHVKNLLAIRSPKQKQIEQQNFTQRANRVYRSDQDFLMKIRIS